MSSRRNYFYFATKTTKADAAGKWRVKLDALKVGDPLTLTVKGKNTVTISDVLVGEVWVGSGQSNMDGRVSGYAKGDEVLADLAKKSFPQIRHINSRGVWQVATPQASGGFGALQGYGRRPALLIVDVNYIFCGDRPEPILESIKR